MGPAVSISDLDVWRGEAHVLHGVSFALAEGEVTALLGRNGVGKTTTLLAVMGLVASTGSIRLGGTELIGMQTHHIARLGIGYVPEDREVFSGLSVSENLKLAARPNGEHRYDLVYELFPDLKARLGQTAGSLSGGQQQMLAIARALLNPNHLLLVDEPTKGLAPIVVEDVMNALRTAAEQTTVVLVEQNLAVATQLATDAVVLDQGRVVHSGSMATLAGDADLTGRFLGVEVR